jgi:TolB protein
MNRIHACILTISVITIALLFNAGCNRAGAANAPIAASRPVVEKDAPAGCPAAPEEVSLFGAHPDSERMPYENRTLANMNRHTFSTVGRDFDPDLHSDGVTMVFASTRNSERPDIFIKNVDGYAITQLTSDPADDIQPRWNPQGDKVVFSSNRAGNWDIWLVNCDGTNLTQITQDRTDEVAPCFSPDGRKIAFTVWGQRSDQWEIWTCAVDRPGIRRFLCYGMFPDWSPDGQRITFQRARQRGTRWFSVWTIELVGEEARHPTEIAYSDSYACIAPRWSPDGQSIAYCAVSQTAARTSELTVLPADVWVVDARNGIRSKMTDGAAGAFNPTWSNTGRIYFVSAREGVENIWSLQGGTSAIAAQPPHDRTEPFSRAEANAPATTEGK